MKRLADQIFNRRRTLSFACMALIALAAAGLNGLSLNASYTAYFDAADPLMRAHNRVTQQFSGHDNVVVVLDTSLESALEPAAITLLRELVAEVKSLSGVVDVRSILDVIEAAPQDSDAEAELALLLDLDPVGIAAADNVESVLDDPRGPGLLLSHDGSALLLDVAYELPNAGGARQVLDALQQLRQVVDAHIGNAAFDISAHYSGSLALNEAYVKTVRHDLRVFAPALLLGMIGVLLILFRNLWLGISMLGVAAGAVVCAFGIAGWLGLELAAISAFAPVIIVSLSVAGSVHIASRYAANRRSHSVERALRTSLQENLLPLSLTGITTACGFAALTMSPSPPIQVMGIVIAIGVFVAWLLNLTVLPVILGKLRGPIRSGAVGTDVLARVSRRHSRLLGPLFLIGGGVAAVLAAQSQINDNVFKYFDSDHQFRRDTAHVHQLFSGVNRLTYVIDSGQALGLFDQALLTRVVEFRQWLHEQPEVTNALAITDIPRIKQALEQPDATATISRYRELAQDVTTDGLGISQLADRQFAALAVHVYLKPVDAQALIAFDQRVGQWLAQHTTAYATSGGVGPSLLFAHLGQRNARSMIIALLVSTGVAALICGLITGTVRGALAGLFLNVFPVASVYAVWALAGGHISMGGAVVIGMILGVIVDDTLYLLTHYRRATDSGSADAVADAVKEVGPALAITTVTLCAGLAAGLNSDFTPIATMSLLSIAIIAIALATDLLALPAFIQKRPRRRTTVNHEIITADN